MVDAETQHQRRRRERAERRATKARQRAESATEAARAETAHIPMGQPVLVGHHSQRKHERALERADRKASRAVAEAREADDKVAAARRAGKSISSDDPEALDALRAKLTELEGRRDAAKEHNRRARAEGREQLPAYHLRNINNRIRQTRQRIAELEQPAQSADPIVTDAVRIEEDADDNRIRLYFGAKPSAEVRSTLKRHGFRWSRASGAWQRQLNNAARHAAKRVAEGL